MAGSRGRGKIARSGADLEGDLNGYGIALAPESAARYYARPGITYRPVTGVSPGQAGVAWPPADDTKPVVADFVRCCLDNKPPHHLKHPA